MSWPPTYLQWFLIVSLPLMGIVYAFLGGIKLPLSQRLGLDEGRVGKLVAGFGMMVGPTILLSGFLADALGKKYVFLTGAVLVVAALLVLAQTRTFQGAVVGVLLLGAGWSATINVANVLVGVAVPEEKLTQAMQFSDFLFGFGAFVTPMILGLLLKRTGYAGGVGLLAAISAVPIVMGFFAVMDPKGAGGGAGLFAGLDQLFANRVFWLTSLAFLFYVPLESSVAGWATTLVSRHAPEDPRTARLASISLMAFWLCFTGSRLLVAILGIHEGREIMLLSLSLASVAVILGIVFLPGRMSAVALVVAAGLVFGPIFPVLISKIIGVAPAGTGGRAVGFFFAFGSVGWTFIPSLIGNVAKRTNIQRGFLVASASSAVFLVFVIVQFLTRAAPAVK